MSALPEIIKEPRIVSGKTKEISGSNDVTVQSLPNATGSNQGLALSLDFEPMSNNKKDTGRKSDSARRNESARRRKLYIKRQLSLENSQNDVSNNEHLPSKMRMASTELLLDEEKLLRQHGGAGGGSTRKLPSLLMNEGKRSTAYTKVIKSSDFDLVRNAPIATRLIYNWKPLERVSYTESKARVKLFKPKKKIENTSQAPSPYKLQWGWETSDACFHNEKRALEMKSIKYMADHAKWSVYPYGNSDEREEYNKTIRATLKGQIEQKELSVKNELVKKMLEFKFVSEQDRLAREEDKRKRVDKYKYLNKFRDTNKAAMEDRWTHEYLLKRHEWQRESELLQQDPINWSKTLR